MVDVVNQQSVLACRSMHELLIRRAADEVEQHK